MHADPTIPSTSTNFLHVICDSPYCRHALTLGISETVEDAIHRANDMMSTGNLSARVAASPSGITVIPDMRDTEEARALHAAAVIMGWRRELQPDGTRKTYCADHVGDRVCARCASSDCSCVGGPLFDVVLP